MNANEITWTARNDARIAARLRELSSDLADDVRTGERTADEANGIYERATTRWSQEG